MVRKHQLAAIRRAAAGLVAEQPERFWHRLRTMIMHEDLYAPISLAVGFLLYFQRSNRSF
jgi:hypothetical protein